MKGKIWIWIVSISLAMLLFWVYRWNKQDSWVELEEKRIKLEAEGLADRKVAVEEEKKEIEKQRKELENEDIRRLRRLELLDRYQYLSK